MFWVGLDLNLASHFFVAFWFGLKMGCDGFRKTLYSTNTVCAPLVLCTLVTSDWGGVLQ